MLHKGIQWMAYTPQSTSMIKSHICLVFLDNEKGVSTENIPLKRREYIINFNSLGYHFKGERNQ